MNAIIKRQLQDYLELTKPRILSLVLVTTALGFLLGGGTARSGRLVALLFGTALVCAGASALNHYLERDADRLMLRTRQRPLPAGRIAPPSALLFGTLLVLGGVVYLCWRINLLTAFLSLLAAFLYVLVYTPLKKVSWWNTSIGAIPGALPPVGGWAAANGEIGTGAWILFAILFLWQHPHFYAIAWMFRDDYARGGFRMLPVIDEGGRRTFSHIICFCLLLLPVSLLPAWTGMTGRIYLAGALGLGLSLLQKGFALRKSATVPAARTLLRSTIVYLPALLILILVDTAR